MNRIPVQIKKLDAQAILPKYATAFSTCADVFARVQVDRENPLGTAVIAPGATAVVRTGLSVRPASGFAIKLFPRSGLALKHGVSLANSVGVIDHDFPDELCVLLRNNGAEPFTYGNGYRIAQLEVHPLLQADFQAVAELTPVPKVAGMVERTGGFGSTGIEPSLLGTIAADEVAAVSASDRSKNIGHALSMVSEFLMECSIESATGVTHFAAEEVALVLASLGANIKAGHAQVVIHDLEMGRHTAERATQALLKV